MRRRPSGPLTILAVAAIAALLASGLPAPAVTRAATASLIALGEVLPEGATSIDHIVLVYDGGLDPTSVPETTDFSVTMVDANQHVSVSSVSIAYVMYGGLLSVVRLGLDPSYALDPSFNGGDIGYATYSPGLTPGTHPLSVGGVPVDGFVNQSVGIAMPDFQFGVALTDEGQGPNHVIALFTQPLTTGPLPDPGDFSLVVTPAVGPTVTVTPVEVSVAAALRGYGGGFLDLRLADPLASDDVVTLTYTPGAISGSPPLADLAGTVLGSGFMGQPVTMNLAPTSTRTTDAGSNVVVAPADSSTGTQPATLTFSDVTAGGTTTLTTSTTAPPLPGGYQLLGTYYDLQTTALYSGDIRVCFSYPGAPATPPTTLLHYDSTILIPAWVPIQDTPADPADVAVNRICGTTTSLSPFAIATWTAPVLTVPSNVSATATGPTGAVVLYSATAVNSAGQPLAPVCIRASGSTFPVGTTTVTCTATDGLGYTSSAPFPVTVGYGFAGFVQPLNDPISATNPLSVFKGGSTIPVKFALTYANGAPILDTAASAIATACGATISLAQTAATAPSVDEVITSTTPNAGTCFRYDSGTQKFIFNLGTNGLPAPAQYALGARIIGPDTTVLASHTLAIGLR